MKKTSAEEKKTMDHWYLDELSRVNNELANTQRELIKKNIELEKANELKNNFLGMTAHDLRNPLGAIHSYSSYLLDEMTSSEDNPYKEFLEVINTSSDFMLHLVEELLDVSVIEAGKLELKLEKVNIVDLLRKNININRILSNKKQIEILFVCRKEIVEVSIDAVKIDQVLNNLISNAIKFSFSETTIEVMLEKNEEAVIITVKDQGQGIPPDSLEQIFDPFIKTRTKTTGGENSTGLGLAITHRIIEGHKGKITVDSKLGEGTRFRVFLPLD